MVVLSPILSAEGVSDSKDRIKQLIDQQGGEVTKENQWGMRRLAYPIRKAGQTFLEGNYVLTWFSTDNALSRDLEGQLNLSEDVIRYLVVKSERPKPIPVPVVAEPVAETQEAGEGEEVSAEPAATEQAVVEDVLTHETAPEPESAEQPPETVAVLETDVDVAETSVVEEAPADQEDDATGEEEAAVDQAATEATVEEAVAQETAVASEPEDEHAAVEEEVPPPASQETGRLAAVIEDGATETTADTDAASEATPEAEAPMATVETSEEPAEADEEAPPIPSEPEDSAVDEAGEGSEEDTRNR